MARRLNLARLDAYARPPASGDEAWFAGAEDSVTFLKEIATGDEILIHATGPMMLITGVLAPTSQATPADHDDLLDSFVESDDTWCIQKSYGGGESHRIYLEPPLSSPGCRSLVGGEMLFYKRSFHGTDLPVQVELSQKLVHCLDLHYMPDRSAYCRLDDHGDIEEVIRIIRRGQDDADQEIMIVTILAKDLATYMALSGMSLVYRFDFTRFAPSTFTGWAEGGREYRQAPDLFYNVGVGHMASFANGCMIVRPTITSEDLVNEWKEELDPSKREYATFKIYDRKNQREIETSCGPSFLSNYFQESDLPWEISPAFFRPEVLHRFKADPEKYSLDDRTISCRNAWYLKTYDINEAGQVHTYIGYLANLPIEEQRYWQSFNEWPKGPISKRALENDILGEFSSDYEPLDGLKRKITRLNELKPNWWSFRSESVIDAARYPASDSVLEWGNEILALDQMVVEGFLSKPLRRILNELGKTLDANWGSLRLLQEYATTRGNAQEDAIALLDPLRTLHRLRTTLRGHSSTTEKKSAEQNARKEHGNLRAHYKDLVGRCDAAIAAIMQLLDVADSDD